MTTIQVRERQSQTMLRLRVEKGGGDRGATASSNPPSFQMVADAIAYSYKSQRIEYSPTHNSPPPTTSLPRPSLRYGGIPLFLYFLATSFRWTDNSETPLSPDLSRSIFRVLGRSAAEVSMLLLGHL